MIKINKDVFVVVNIIYALQIFILTIFLKFVVTV